MVREHLGSPLNTCLIVQRFKESMNFILFCLTPHPFAPFLGGICSSFSTYINAYIDIQENSKNEITLYKLWSAVSSVYHGPLSRSTRDLEIYNSITDGHLSYLKIYFFCHNKCGNSVFSNCLIWHFFGLNTLLQA